MVCGSWTVLAGAVAWAPCVAAATDLPLANAPSSYNLPEASAPVRVDGVLDDEAWRAALVLPLAYEIDPGENIPARVQTDCLLTADTGRLYIGCRAEDPEPAAIRARYQDRDVAWDDDWILLSMDSFGDQRRAFEFLVNPLGVQMDTVLTEVAGGGTTTDSTWDALWQSAGRITARGYEVEVAIPFTSLRFARGGGIQRWGFQAVRHYPRKFSYFFRTAPWERSRGCTLCESLVLVGFSQASPGRNLELAPTLAARWRDRAPPEAEGRLRHGSIRAEPGLSARWGITPNLSLNAAVNPDFSQVEADAAQLDVNVRFALFYAEKRPFFLEGGDLFKTPVNVVYSRTVADPRFGLKLTGKEARHALGVLVTQDARTNLLLPGNQASRLVSLDQRTTDTVLRYRRDLGARSTLGALVTDRRGGEYASSVLGVDGHLSPASGESVDLQLLRSTTRYPPAAGLESDLPRGTFRDWAAHLTYRHESRNWSWWGEYESLGRRFRADAGFLPRVDTRTVTLGLKRILWPSGESWFSRINLALEGRHVADQRGRLSDRSLGLTAEVNGPRRSTLSLGLVTGQEVFGGASFDTTQAKLTLTAWASPSLAVTLSGASGRAIDYAGLRSGQLSRVNPALTGFLGRHVQLGLDHALEQLDLPGGRLYRANLSQARLVYQFSSRVLLRAIAQREQVRRDPALHGSATTEETAHRLTQWLFSYRLNCCTGVFLGYSDTREGGARALTDRTFFVKVGYAWLP